MAGTTPLRGIPNLERFAAMCEPPPSQQAQLNVLWDSQTPNQTSAAELWADTDKQQDYLQQQQTPTLLVDHLGSMNEGAPAVIPELCEPSTRSPCPPPSQADDGMQFLKDLHSEVEPSHVSETPSQVNDTCEDGSQAQPPNGTPAVSPALLRTQALPASCVSRRSSLGASQSSLEESLPRVGARTGGREASSPGSLMRPSVAAGAASCSRWTSQQPFTQSPGMLATGCASPLPYSENAGLSPIYEQPSAPPNSPGGGGHGSSPAKATPLSTGRPSLGMPSKPANPPDLPEGEGVVPDAAETESPEIVGTVPRGSPAAMAVQLNVAGQPAVGSGDALQVELSKALAPVPCTATPAEAPAVGNSREGNIGHAEAPVDRKDGQYTSSGSSDKFENIQYLTPPSEEVTCSRRNTGPSSPGLTSPAATGKRAGVVLVADGSQSERPVVKVRRKLPRPAARSAKGSGHVADGPSALLAKSPYNQSRGSIKGRDTAGEAPGSSVLPGQLQPTASEPAALPEKQCSSLSVPPCAQPVMSAQARDSLRENVHCGNDLVLWWWGLI